MHHGLTFVISALSLSSVGTVPGKMTSAVATITLVTAHLCNDWTDRQTVLMSPLWITEFGVLVSVAVWRTLNTSGEFRCSRKKTFFAKNLQDGFFPARIGSSNSNFVVHSSPPHVSEVSYPRVLPKCPNHVSSTSQRTGREVSMKQVSI